MENHWTSDAWIAARRCWQAMDEAQDERTRRSLWRAAVKYAGRARKEGEARQSGEDAAPLARRLEGGSFRGAREW